MTSMSLGDKDRWDIGIDAYGNLVFVEKLDEVVQNLRSRIIFIRKEWRYNKNIGFPWWEFVFINNPNLITIESILKKTILKTHGVTKILDFEMSLKNNMLSVFFRVDTIYGIAQGEI
jgi:hypothetical protein